MTPGAVTSACPYCRAPIGERCGVRGWNTWRARPAVRPHKQRVKLALVLAAHSDPALDAFLPRLGPCGICATAGLDQRHRVVDAIAERLEAGEDPEDTAGEFGVTPEAVEAVTLWMVRWPGAWQ